MKAIPLVDHPILCVEDEERMLVVGDLHIGIESEMRRMGVHVPSQTHRMEQELISLAHEGTRLIVLGDVKHRVPGSTTQEHREVPKFFERMLEKFEHVDIVKGNHDSNIEAFVPPGVDVHPGTGMRLGEVGFVHGHTWPSRKVMGARTLLMAHNHPVVMFKDGVGKKTTEMCWMRATMLNDGKRYIDVPEEVIVIPALNRALGGSPVNIMDHKLLGPLLNPQMVDLPNARIYLTDGIFLGRLEGLMVTDRRMGSYRSRRAGSP